MVTTPAAVPLEADLAAVLAGVLDVDEVSPDSDFFRDLGADSLVMARFCARVRKQPGLPAISMRDVYRDPTIRGLVASVEGSPDDGPATAPSSPPSPPDGPSVRQRTYVACGALQLLLVAGYAAIAAELVLRGAAWVAAASGPIDAYLRIVAVSTGTVAFLSVVPVLAKWLLVGPSSPRTIRAWSLDYVRFWAVRAVARTSPLAFYVGTPLYTLHLRALGARVAWSALVLTRHQPACPDLLSVGENAVVGKDALITCSRTRPGVVETGPVTVGDGAVVGESSVLDIGTALGTGARLDRSSSLQSGQRVPDRETWHGSPARPRPAAWPDPVAALPVGAGRRAAYACGQLLTLVAVLVPAAVAAGYLLVTAMTEVAAGIAGAAGGPVGFAAAVVAVATGTFVGLIGLGLAAAFVVPRLLARAVPPEAVHPLYGLRYACHRVIGRLSNVPFFPHLLGDSSYVVPYLRMLGYDLSDVEQTGSNFGLEFKHDHPHLCTVGRGTVIADGLSIVNTEYSGSGFRVRRVRIGAASYLGNYVVHPPAATGEDVLLANKVLVPIEGPTRHGLGLLGSPPFEIPRSVDRDQRFAAEVREARRRRLPAKNRHNAVTICLLLLARWVQLVWTIALVWVVVELQPGVGPWVSGVAALLVIGLGICQGALVERAATGFRPLQPRICSIYDPYFWWHERFWKLASQPLILDGTPLKGLAWRLLGVRIGRRLLDDGAVIVEKTLVRIGDDCALNAGSVIQPHSQEDFTFKSGTVEIGAGCTIGVGAFVHYSTTLGDRAELGADAFLMKGEDVPSGVRWVGNPARDAASVPLVRPRPEESRC